MATGLVKHADAAVEGSVFSLIPESCYPMLDVIPVIPLVPSQVVQLEEKSLGPPLAGLSAALGKVVPLLEMLPFGRDETFQQVLPADGGLRLDGLGDSFIFKGSLRELGPAPAVEVVKNGFLDSWEGVGVVKVLGEGFHAFVPHCVGSLGRASQDMGGRL